MIIPAPLSGDGNMQWKVTAPSTDLPISVDEAKFMGRIDGDYEDDLIGSLIQSVSDAVERYIGRALLIQTLTASLDFWPENPIKLPRPPLVSITSVNIVQEDLTSTEYSSDNYYARIITTPGELVLKDGVTPPENTDRYHGGFEIVFVAGYGTTDDIPSAIKDAIKLWTVVLYETRTAPSDPPPEIKGLLDFYRIRRV